MFLRLFACISKSFTFHSTAKAYCSVVLDQNYNYFRNRAEYQNLVVQLKVGARDSRVSPSEFSSLLKEYQLDIEDFYTHLMHRDHVMRLSTAQVRDVLCLMANDKIDTTKYAQALRYLDEKCTLSVERWPPDTSFYILDAFFVVLGPKVFRRHYYSAITNQWSRRLKRHSKHNLLLMLHFIGMSRHPPPFIMEAIEDRMEGFASKLSDEETALLCQCYFKTSWRLTSDILLKQACAAAERLLKDNRQSSAIDILNCLRLSKHYDPQLWDKVKKFAVEQQANLSFVQCTKLLAVFAAQNLYDEELFSSLEYRGFTLLDKENLSVSLKVSDEAWSHSSSRGSIKDYAQFLWALSCVGHNVKVETLDLISQTLKQCLELDEFENQYHLLVDCLQSLALMNYYPNDLLKLILNKSTLTKISQIDKQKPKYQFYFVQKAVQIERPDLCSTEILNYYHPIPRNLEKDIKERSALDSIIKIIDTVSKKDPSINYRCCYLLPHIMIAGLIITKSLVGAGNPTKSIPTQYKKCIDDGLIAKELKVMLKDNCVCIEVLDPLVCIRDSSLPHGLMRTKLRHLSMLGFKVVTLLPNEINNLRVAPISEWSNYLNRVLK